MAQAKSRPVAVVTGAGSGIGRATALALAAQGHDLALAGRSRAPLEVAASLIGRSSLKGATCLVVPTDMSDPGAVRRLIDETLARFGRLDVLVNNAGLAESASIAQTTPDLFRRTLDLNTLGPACAILAAWPTFIRQRRGCVVNVSSLASRDPFPGFFAYAASKAAVNLLARSCALEGREHGIRAFAVAPGAVETPMLRAIFDEQALPKARTLSPESVARVIVDCAMGGRDRENGETIFLSAGGAG